MSALKKIVVVGSKGRMGQAVVKLATPEAGFEVVGQIDVGDNILNYLDQADAVIEFSQHAVSPFMAGHAAKHRKTLVIGTTGHTRDELNVIHKASESIPLVLAPNFSIGVNTLFYVTRKIAEILGPDYDQEVVEMHHRYKTDAPSGTARRVAEILAEVKNRKLEEIVRHGRVGDVGQRTRDEIGIHALRGGDVVADISVHFAGIGEHLEITDRATMRTGSLDVFPI